VLPIRPLDAIHVRGDLKPLRGFRSRMKVAREASDHLPFIADLKIGWAGHAESKRVVRAHS
jgi:endonuclease/exonuclease/phosphatase family metal-dependent hydrolase